MDNDKFLHPYRDAEEIKRRQDDHKAEMSRPVQTQTGLDLLRDEARHHIKMSVYAAGAMSLAAFTVAWVLFGDWRAGAGAGGIFMLFGIAWSIGTMQDVVDHIRHQETLLEIRGCRPVRKRDG